MWGFPVVSTEAIDELFGGLALGADQGILDELLTQTAAGNWHRDPLRAGGGFNLIALLPGALGELHGIEKNKSVHFVNQGKVAYPGQEGGLHDGNPFR